MNKRTCEVCRFWHKMNSVDQNGDCRRYPPVWITHGFDRPNMQGHDTCGEWRDKAMTTEQEQRAELVEQFAVALVGTDNYGPDKVWECAKKLAEEYVDEKPKVGGES